ncbi:MAG: hypothetical protein N4A33_12220 [Bacteriovoracaceae bacterium]|jgi:hypothetical protein|nr:hypothetical protein [Bacteriovoracaceae bacterium]
MEEFKTLLVKNLKNNGFPDKKIAFDIETIYEKCDQRGFSFNKLVPLLEEEGIAVDIQTEKIIFSKLIQQEAPNLEDQMEMAKKMMENMSPQQLDNIKKMYEQMSDTDKEELMKKAKDMGML